MGRYMGLFNDRVLLDLVDGKLMFKGCQVCASDASFRLSLEMQQNLADESGAHITDYHRILECRVCSRYYVGHWHSAFCSDDCRKLVVKQWQVKAAGARKERRRRQIAFKGFRCICGNEFAAQRKSAMYCGPACRQRAKRLRDAFNTPLKEATP
ncbi:MAG: hypothetical protein KDI16_10700 [Halioglobus sp.]|nr:hypothetical protein [Halioglobus sp.]